MAAFPAIHIPKLQKSNLLEPNVVDIKSLAKNLNSISCFYPGFKEWLYFTFQPGISTGQRKVLIFGNQDFTAGYSLLKLDTTETKICTFFILPEYRGHGIGHDFLSQTVKYCRDRSDMPIRISVSEEKKTSLDPLLLQNKFKIKSIKREVYRKNRKEFFYET